MQLSAISEVLFIVGGLLLIIALLFRRFPPPNINMLYGYRTARSMQTKEAWDFSQKVSARYLLWLSVIMLLAATVFLFIDVEGWSPFLTIGILFGIMIPGFGVLIFTVEKKLRNRFGNTAASANKRE